MIAIFKKKWVSLTKREKTSKIGFWTFKLTPIRFSLRQTIERMLCHNHLGSILDVGAGSLLYKNFLEKRSVEYISTDLYSDHKDLDFHWDIKDLKFTNNRFDTVFCNQVLEHIDNPIMALEEIKRVLKNDGILVIGVPFYFYLHSIPHDYYRYTEYGIRYLLEKTGYEIQAIYPDGGYFSAFIEPINIIFTSIGCSIPIWQDFINLINFIFFVLPPFWLDKSLKTFRWFPCSYVCLARLKNKENNE